MFVFEAVPPGEEVLTISHLAYGEQMRALTLEPGTAYRVNGQVSPTPIELEGIAVEATSQHWFRKMDGLKWRMDRGLGGEFILEDELESRGYPPVADALRTLPGEFAGFGANCAVVIWTKRGR
jgi:hypothetical protein